MNVTVIGKGFINDIMRDKGAVFVKNTNQKHRSWFIISTIFKKKPLFGREILMVGWSWKHNRNKN